MRLGLPVIVLAWSIINCCSFSTWAPIREHPSRLWSSGKGDSSWDDDVDYEKVWNENGDKEDIMPNTDWDAPSLSSSDDTSLKIPGVVSDLLDSETAAELKEEARDIINDKIQEGLDQIKKLRKELNTDIDAKKQAMERSSQARAERESKALMEKIDALTDSFLEESRASRESTKRIAEADAAMEGKGVDLGSWGVLGDAVVTMESAGGLLGSMDSAKKKQEQQKNQENSDTTESADADISTRQNRILIVADQSSDPTANILVPKVSNLLSEMMAVDIEVIKPTQLMPLGGNNAACVVFFLSSFSSNPKTDRILQRTLLPDGSIGRPPTQLIGISTIGTERTNKMPYSMQNLLGRKLDARRDMEESIINTVINRQDEPSLDYTILKFGELKESSDSFFFMPFDVLDGTTPAETAAQVLIQAMAFQPAARNATLCATGKLPELVDDLFWDDNFLRLKGPELARYENLGIPNELFGQLTEYLKEWGEVLVESGKLTTPARFEPSLLGPNAALEGVAQRDGLKLVFEATRTGANYVSKEEERKLEKRGVKAAPLRAKPEGGIEVLVEITTQDQLRVRATRTNMAPKTIIKELSEQSILRRLKESLEIFVQKNS